MAHAQELTVQLSNTMNLWSVPPRFCSIITTFLILLNIERKPVKYHVEIFSRIVILKACVKLIKQRYPSFCDVAIHKYIDQIHVTSLCCLSIILFLSKMKDMPVTICSSGDHAITITFCSEIDEGINDRILGLFGYLKEKELYGVMDLIPSFCSLTVVYDVVTILKCQHELCAFDYIRLQVEEALKASHPFTGSSKPFHVPVCYHTSLGMDLIEISDRQNLPVDEIIRLHSSETYRVYMLGFMPGFAYMGKVNTRIAVDRKPVPTRVLAGSVGIAGRQTGVYPFDAPGGWNIIGKTPLPFFSKDYKEPCLLSPGDYVKFEPITLGEYYKLQG